MNEQDFFDKRYRMFKKKIQNVVKAVGVPDEVVSFVPFVATGDLSEPRLPGIHNWLIAFWLTTFKRLNDKAKPAFLIANVARFNCISSSDQEVSRNRLSRSLSKVSNGEEINFKSEYNEEVSRDSNPTIVIMAMPMITPRVKMTADQLLEAFP